MAKIQGHLKNSSIFKGLENNEIPALSRISRHAGDPDLYPIQATYSELALECWA